MLPCRRKLTYSSEPKTGTSLSVQLTGYYSVRITNTGAVPVTIEDRLVLQPLDTWSASGDHPGDELVGSVRVQAQTGTAEVLVETLKV